MGLAEETEKSIRSYRVRQEQRLLELVGLLSEATDEEPGEIMQTVTSYEGRNGRVTGGWHPSLLNDQRLIRSIADAEAWLKSLRGKK